MASDHDLQPLLESLRNQYQLVMNESSSIDTKALALIGTSLAILIFIGQASLDVEAYWLGFGLVVSLLLSIVLSIATVWRWPYVGASVDLKDKPEYLEMDRDSLVLQLLSDTEYAIARNKLLNFRRWLCMLASFLFMSLGTLLLFVIM